MIRTSRLADFLQLTKPKVTLLNLLVGVTCFVLAACPKVDWVNLVVFLAVGYSAAGGCGVLNSAYDRDIDMLMPRTAKRAIPTGHVAVNDALVLGIAMIAASLTVSLVMFNPLTGLMIGLGVVFYVFIYTFWLKRTSPWNVVIGGFAGCFAGLSGWTAAVNTVSLMPLLIALVGFVWTPGHLWGLAIKKIKEYKTAGIPMLPVKVGLIRASQVVFFLNLLTVALSLVFPILHLTGIIYLSVALAAGSVFLFQNRGLLVSACEEQGFRVFLFSMPYLTCLMVGLIIDKVAFI